MRVADTSVRSMLDVARALAPLVRQYADETERLRQLPRPLFEALADAGLFHMMVPRSIGGGEIDLPTYVRVMEEIGKADASTAWCINQGGVFAIYSACVSPKVAREIWIDTPRAVVANTAAPTFTAESVAGGFRVTGKGGFSTGCRHASWLAARARVVDDGQPRLLPNGKQEIRFCLVPVGDAEIIDTWHTRGMRGTGTNHFATSDVFVPEERTFTPGARPLTERGPLYVILTGLLFPSGDAAIAIGLAQTTLDALLDLAGAKSPHHYTNLMRDLPLVQTTVGHAAADLRSARALLRETVREVWDAVAATGTITLEQRTSLRLATTHAIRLAAKVVDAVYNAAGATAIFESHPIQRYFQDMHVITQHFQSRLDHYELVGRAVLGLDVGDEMP
jgi:alkylation response protein AidB-like acyl-CoA dehydrogenase